MLVKKPRTMGWVVDASQNQRAHGWIDRHAMSVKIDEIQPLQSVHTDKELSL